MLDKINRERHEHIVTIEDPIEFVHQHRGCVVNQREVFADTHAFHDALRHVLRQDPDVVLIGEMRDLETIASALTVAETGHLVLSTLHTNSAVQTINRIIDIFPADQQPQIRAQLSLVLQGVVSQGENPPDLLAATNRPAEIRHADDDTITGGSLSARLDLLRRNDRPRHRTRRSSHHARRRPPRRTANWHVTCNYAAAQCAEERK
jgi:type IV secretory pathway ATPase VirB11/archaellum biosynthesis ATPase